MSKTAWIVIVVIGALLLCCCCLAVAGFVGFAYLVSTGSDTLPLPTDDWNWPDDNSYNNTPLPPLPTPIPTTQLTPGPTTPAAAFETLKTLNEALVPNNDPRDLAQHLKGISDIPLYVDPAPAYNVGDKQTFWVTNVDTNDSFQVNTTLQYETEHVYFWVEDGVKFNADVLRDLVEEFENQIYPTNREFFGSEWTPGVDGDPHLYIVYAQNLGSTLAGYFSSADSLHPLAHEYSNGHETFMLNADNISLDEDFTYGVLSHEFQHMIHWYGDANEESWLNEGFSELATLLNDYDPGGFDYAFIRQPDLQLNDWPNDPNATTPHYGAGFLFTTYLLDRFGEETTKAIVADPNNGLHSIDLVFERLNIRDPQTDKVLTADSVFTDWTLANLLQNAKIADGRYSYKSYDPSSVPMTQTLSDCQTDWKNSTVYQYGTDYIALNCKSNYTIEFSGPSTVGVLPINAYSGDYAFWSNKGDESDMRLTHSFDFSNVQGPLEISYRLWHDLETDYDYAYLEASLDGGKTWQILTTPTCTTEDPSGNSFGCGYNGKTQEWIEEKVDLSQFAGKQVLLRFEYVTDAAVNGEGLLLDDIAIPAINYFSDFESDDGGWQAEGFVRIQNLLPQTFSVALVQKDNPVKIQKYTVQDGHTLSIPVNGSEGDVVLVISGTTRATRQVARYQFRLVP